MKAEGLALDWILPMPAVFMSYQKVKVKFQTETLPDFRFQPVFLHACLFISPIIGAPWHTLTGKWDTWDE